LLISGTDEAMFPLFPYSTLNCLSDF